jgi:hypothetical protein
MTRRHVILSAPSEASSNLLNPGTLPPHKVDVSEEGLLHQNVSTPASTILAPPEGSLLAHNHHPRIINASLLITAGHEPQKDMSVVVQSGKISQVGLTKDLTGDLRHYPSTSVPVLMPGLWDGKSY